MSGILDGLSDEWERTNPCETFLDYLEYPEDEER